MDYYASLFASKVSGGGGGGGGSSDLVALLDGSIVSLTNSDVTELRKYALNNCNNLQSVSLPNCTKLNEQSISSCSNLISLSLPSVSTLGGGYVFTGCSKLTTVVLPSLSSITSNNTFQNCSQLKIADFGANTPGIGNNWFNNCGALDTVILRKTSGVVPLNGGIGAFNNTPFASGKSGGTLYVPNDLISSYQSASNWATILGYANNQIKKIEGSIYENAYADGTPIS